jgi:hypothetical protein
MPAFNLIHEFGQESNPDAGITRRELVILVNGQKIGPVRKFKPDDKDFLVGAFDGGENVLVREQDVTSHGLRTPIRETSYTIPMPPKLNPPAEGSFRVEEIGGEGQPAEGFDEDAGPAAGPAGGGESATEGGEPTAPAPAGVPEPTASSGDAVPPAEAPSPVLAEGSPATEATQMAAPGE